MPIADISLSLLPGEFSIHSLPPSSDVPRQVLSEALFAVTRTARELSVVCLSEVVVPGGRVESGWSLLMVNGILDFSLTGILAGISNVLADEKISIFALSTYETDCILVKKKNTRQAIKALARAGYSVNVPNE